MKGQQQRLSLAQSWFYFSRAVEVLGRNQKARTTSITGRIDSNYQRQTCRWQWIIQQQRCNEPSRGGTFPLTKKEKRTSIGN